MEEGTTIQRSLSSPLRLGPSDSWVRCDGPARSNCSDWTFIEPNQSVALKSPDDRFVLHNTEFNASVTFENTRILATSKDITIYANSVNPLVRPSSQPTTYDVPEGLSPSQAEVLTQPQVALKWQASSSQSTDPAKAKPTTSPYG